jgi:hypothetical protein
MEPITVDVEVTSAFDQGLAPICGQRATVSIKAITIPKGLDTLCAAVG